MEDIAANASRQVGRSRPSANGSATAPLTRRSKISPLISIFIVLLAVPINFHFGGLRLSPYRLLLIATFIPCLLAWFSGRTGRIRAPDIFMLLTTIWAAVALVSVHGVDGGLQTAGIFAIETFGTFLFAKRYIRDIYAFQHMVKCLVLMVIFLLPFAAYENLTGSAILVKLFGAVFSVFELYGPNEARFGLNRAQVTFEHPILFGVVCSSVFALSFYVSSRGLLGKLASSLVAITTFTSLSAGALLSLVIQGALIAWDKVTASVSHRWTILVGLAIAAFVAVSFLSNRSPIEVLISYLTFNADQSYMRIYIWNYGTQSVMKNPIFGIGLNDWERPDWMGGSMDNFWLVNAVRYGIPGFLFLFCGFVSVCFGLGRLKKLSFQAAQCRKGLIIALSGFAIAGITVHVWNATYVLLIFLLGSSMWLFEYVDRTALTSTQSVPSAVRPMR